METCSGGLFSAMASRRCPTCSGAVFGAQSDFWDKTNIGKNRTTKTVRRLARHGIGQVWPDNCRRSCCGSDVNLAGHSGHGSLLRVMISSLMTSYMASEKAGHVGIIGGWGEKTKRTKRPLCVRAPDDSKLNWYHERCGQANLLCFLLPTCKSCCRTVEEVVAAQAHDVFEAQFRNNRTMAFILGVGSLQFVVGRPIVAVFKYPPVYGVSSTSCLPTPPQSRCGIQTEREPAFWFHADVPVFLHSGSSAIFGRGFAVSTGVTLKTTYFKGPHVSDALPNRRENTRSEEHGTLMDHESKPESQVTRYSEAQCGR
ncbi:unnamed protein product [Protopolystoma xenopodis]|uniref:Uncharacterized protein n=1 Tax=Protopolystoma xenopodis TaxID=117903 RepID=A0A3S5BS13_9PLAT|nr:unnamed protein product [Protopolystoma xenopodis]